MLPPAPVPTLNGREESITRLGRPPELGDFNDQLWGISVIAIRAKERGHRPPGHTGRLSLVRTP